MTRGVPVIDPRVHLKGATPKKLAKALPRQPHLAGVRRPPVVNDKVPVKKVVPGKVRNRVPHLVKRVSLANIVFTRKFVDIPLQMLGRHFVKGSLVRPF